LERRDPNRQTFLDIPAILHAPSSTRACRTSSTTPQFAAKLTTNLAMLGRLAGEMAGEAEREFPVIDSEDWLAARRRGRAVGSIMPQLRRRRSVGRGTGG